MVVNEYSPLNNLTRAGVFDFDAEAYLNGVHPKIVTPAFGPYDNPFGDKLRTPQLQGQLSNDIYDKKLLDELDTNKPSTFKKIVTALTVGGLIIFGALNGKNMIKAIKNGNVMESVSKTFKNVFGKISDKSKHIFSGIKSSIGNVAESIKTKIGKKQS